MINTVIAKKYSEPEFNIDEIFRYMGTGKNGEYILSLVKECIEECREDLTYNVCCREFPVIIRDNIVDFKFSSVSGKTVSSHLSDCKSAIIFAATVGIGIDRYILKYGALSPAKSLIFHAIGAERTESLCDMFCKDIAAELASDKKYTRERFSPGYGDFQLEFQKEIFSVLDCRRKIGLSLNDSLIMTPSKSVTAIIGISDNECKSSLRGCVSCTKEDCKYRK